MAIDYKIKYNELKMKFKDHVEVSFKLGYEQGCKDTQMEMQAQQMQEQQMAMQQQQAAMMGQDPNQDPNMQGDDMAMQDPNMQGEMDPNAQMQDPSQGDAQPSELDSHIGELEQIMAKSEGSIDIELVRKSISALSAASKKKQPLFKGNRFLTPKKEVKETLSSQKKLVSDMVKKWEDESKSVPATIEKAMEEQLEKAKKILKKKN